MNGLHHNFLREALNENLWEISILLLTQISPKGVIQEEPRQATPTSSRSNHERFLASVRPSSP